MLFHSIYQVKLKMGNVVSESEIHIRFALLIAQEGIIPADKKKKILDSDTTEFEKVVDFYVCSQSDVFVPAISGLFYSNVAGKRIASGKTQILVPAYIANESASSVDFVTHYVSKKNHLAYSCFC